MDNSKPVKTQEDICAREGCGHRRAVHSPFAVTNCLVDTPNLCGCMGFVEQEIADALHGTGWIRPLVREASAEGCTKCDMDDIVDASVCPKHPASPAAPEGGEKCTKITIDSIKGDDGYALNYGSTGAYRVDVFPPSEEMPVATISLQEPDMTAKDARKFAILLIAATIFAEEKYGKAE